MECGKLRQVAIYNAPAHVLLFRLFVRNAVFKIVQKSIPSNFLIAELPMSPAARDTSISRSIPSVGAPT